MPEWINTAMLFIVPATAIWVYFDAVSNDIGRNVEPPDVIFGFLWNRSPGGWASLSLLMWIPFFVMYVSLRPRLMGTGGTNAPARGWIFGFWLLAFVAANIAIVVLDSRVPECGSREMIREVSDLAKVAKIESKGGSGSWRRRTCSYEVRTEGGARQIIKAEAKSKLGDFSLEIESTLELAACNDPDYLREVQSMVVADGISRIRSVGEIASTEKMRTCALTARDRDGEEIRLRGTMTREGDGIRLGLNPE